MYADKITGAMREAMAESDRRREKQIAYNKEHQIVPKSIIKKISVIETADEAKEKQQVKAQQEKLKKFAKSAHREEIEMLIADLENQMDLAAQNLEFEKAAELRDEIDLLKNSM